MAGCHAAQLGHKSKQNRESVGSASLHQYIGPGASAGHAEGPAKLIDLFGKLVEPACGGGTLAANRLDRNREPSHVLGQKGQEASL
ncbi:MAG: hypothetical protein ACJAZ8_000357 [Planctomycetota bacterium]